MCPSSHSGGLSVASRHPGRYVEPGLLKAVEQGQRIITRILQRGCQLIATCSSERFIHRFAQTGITAGAAAPFRPSQPETSDDQATHRHYQSGFGKLQQRQLAHRTPLAALLAFALSGHAADRGASPCRHSARTLLIALHARRSADSIAAFARASAPSVPTLLVLTGTDLYRDLARRRRGAPLAASWPRRIWWCCRTQALQRLHAARAPRRA